LRKEHCSCIATLEYEGLLTLLPIVFDDREVAGSIFNDWVI